MPEIVQQTATGKEIEEIINEIAPIIQDKPSAHVMMACLALAMIIQHPDIEPEDLQRGVKEASEWMALYVSSVDPEMHVPVV